MTRKTKTAPVRRSSAHLPPWMRQALCEWPEGETYSTKEIHTSLLSCRGAEIDPREFSSLCLSATVAGLLKSTPWPYHALAAAARAGFVEEVRATTSNPQWERWRRTAAVCTPLKPRGPRPVAKGAPWPWGIAEHTTRIAAGPMAVLFNTVKLLRGNDTTRSAYVQAMWDDVEYPLHCLRVNEIQKLRHYLAHLFLGAPLSARFYMSERVRDAVSTGEKLYLLLTVLGVHPEQDASGKYRFVPISFDEAQKRLDRCGLGGDTTVLGRWQHFCRGLGAQ